LFLYETFVLPALFHKNRNNGSIYKCIASVNNNLWKSEWKKYKTTNAKEKENENPFSHCVPYLTRSGLLPEKIYMWRMAKQTVRFVKIKSYYLIMNCCENLKAKSNIYSEFLKVEISLREK
jgi:hypothetical protein